MRRHEDAAEARAEEEAGARREAVDGWDESSSDLRQVEAELAEARRREAAHREEAERLRPALADATGRAAVVEGGEEEEDFTARGDGDEGKAEDSDDGDLGAAGAPGKHGLIA